MATSGATAGSISFCAVSVGGETGTLATDGGSMGPDTGAGAGCCVDESGADMVEGVSEGVSAVAVMEYHLTPFTIPG